MTDKITAELRSRNMSRIRSKGTKPEMVVRRIVHAMGFRFRLHHKQLPGKPDLVFPKLNKIILVHGCFWHRHNCREGQREPKSRQAYWGPKRQANVIRDRRTIRALRRQGWAVLSVWECQISDKDALTRRISKFLGRFTCRD